MPILVHKVERFTAHAHEGGRTLFFMVRSGSRRRQSKFFEPGEVPEFEGDVGYFEIDRMRGRWVFVRQVEKPKWHD